MGLLQWRNWCPASGSEGQAGIYRTSPFSLLWMPDQSHHNMWCWQVQEIPKIRLRLSNIWRSPLDISWEPGVRVFKRGTTIAQLQHLKYNYARHPRNPNRLPIESFDFIRGYFRQRSKARKKPITYNLIDFLRELRVWANYIDIDNLINLWGLGYRAFLDQNLSTLLFFLASVGELSFLAVRGERKYLGQMQSFYDQFVCKNPEVEQGFTRSPMFHRMLIYQELGLIQGKIKLNVVTDINEISIQRACR